jgi:hypothetical protein
VPTRRGAEYCRLLPEIDAEAEIKPKKDGRTGKRRQS